MKKQLTSFLSLISVVLLLCSNFTDNIITVLNASAEDSYLPIASSFVLDGKRNLIMRDEDGNVISTSANVMNRKMTAATSLPSSYDSRTDNCVTSVKNQGLYGTCWAHGTLSSIESQLISSGYATKSNIDLSEDHLVNFTGKLNELNDGYFSATSSDYIYNCGGLWTDSVTTLSNWWGIEKEENAPYTTGNYDESQRTNSYYHLKEARLLAKYHDDVVNNLVEIKNAIKNNGAVEISYYESEEFRKNYNDPAYNVNDTQYEYKSNHTVSVVGWDDNYSKTNFKYQPSKNGAFLIKNSWGTSFFDKGYMWVSYYSLSLCDVVAFDCEPAENSEYDHIYSYNGYSPGYSYYPSVKSLQYANAFISSGNEKLEAIGLWTMQDDIDYTIKIYRGLSSNTSDPTSGSLASECTTSGNKLRQGYYTVKLNNGITLNKGERYSVVVSIKANSHDYLLYPFELKGYNQPYYDTNNNTQTLTIVYSSNRGESFVCQNSKWMDAKDYSAFELNNARINVYTSDVSTETDNFLRFSPSSLTLQVGETKTVTVISNPGGLSCSLNISNIKSFCTVKGGSSGTFTVTASSVGTGNIYGTMTINGKEYSVTLPVTVAQKNELTNLSLTSMPTKTNYQIGESFNSSGLVLTAHYSNGGKANVTDKCSLSGFSSKNDGSKTITASYTESGKTFTTQFTVNVGCVIQISPSSVKMKVGDPEQQVAVTLPAGAGFSPNFSGVSSFCKCSLKYTASPYLLLTPLSEGTGTIVCTATVNGVTYTATLPVTVDEFDQNEYNEYSYTVNDKGEATITGYTGKATTLTIPSAIDGYIVTAIGEQAIMKAGRETAKSVIIPDTVKSIGNNAFSYCTVLESIVLPSSLETIGNGAFSECYSLKTLNIPSNVTSIGKQCFYQCHALQKVNLNIGNKKLTLGDYAFLDCTSLTKLNIDSSNIEIGFKSLGYCYNFDTKTYSSTGLTICGYQNSPAYAYYSANSDNIKWELLGKVLTGIQISKAPTKTTYSVGENFNSNGMIVTACYSDNSTQAVTDYTYSGFSSSKVGSCSVTIFYTEGTVTKTATILLLIEDPNSDPTITVADTSGKAGQTIVVPITISNNPGICSTRLNISYDNSILELVKVENGEVFSADSFTAGGTLSQIPFTVLWNSGTKVSNTNGTLIYLTFNIKSGVNTGTKADISVDYVYEDTLDYFLNPTWFKTVNGSITVGNNSKISGDADNDGKVTLRDAVLISRFLAGGWNATINEFNADVDCSGSVTLRDAVLISRYLAGGWGVELL